MNTLIKYYYYYYNSHTTQLIIIIIIIINRPNLALFSIECPLT